jgi:hypothetical protein
MSSPDTSLPANGDSPGSTVTDDHWQDAAASDRSPGSTSNGDGSGAADEGRDANDASGVESQNGDHPDSEEFAHSGEDPPSPPNVVGPYQLPDASQLTPPRDGAFFWSGRNADGIGVGPESAGGSGAADRFASSHNGTTLEGLIESNEVSPPKWSFDDPAADEWWSDVSRMYAGNVQGEVHAIVGSNLRPGNIWETVELPRLIENPNVTRIVVIDPDTGVETVIFERPKE